MGNKDPATEKIQGRKMNHQLPGNTRSSIMERNPVLGGGRNDTGSAEGLSSDPADKS